MSDPGTLLRYRVDAAFAADADEDGMRRHLGASVIGKDCMREVWYSFRWVDSEPFEGRMLRLFSRGHRQEEIFADLLRGVGATVWTQDPNGKQFTISALGGHFGGSTDGVVRGLPVVPEGMGQDEPCLLEMKTHNAKWFKELEKKGVKAGFPRHYKQGQIYMHKLGLKWCLYCAVNKNDDALYFEFFQHDLQVCTQLLNRAETIVFGEGIPPKLSESSSWFECKFCAMRHVCHFGKEPRRNCRTCIYATPERDGTWSCQGNQPEIHTQPKIGCQHYSPIKC